MARTQHRCHEELERRGNNQLTAHHTTLGAEIRSRDRARVAPALPEASDCWHLDEMAMRIAGKRMYLWRAVDHEGEVFDLLIQRRRDSRAALRLMRKLLKKRSFARNADHGQAALLRRDISASPTDLSA